MQKILKGIMQVKISHIVVGILLLIIVYLYLSRKPIDNSKPYINYIKKEWQIKQNKLKNDSIRYSNKIDSLINKIGKLNNLRKHERNQHLSEQSKYNNLTTDSSYFAVLDSIKKVCCSNDTSQ